MPGSISGYDKNIYHLLCCAFSQCVAISEVVHFNIFNIVSIRNIHFSIYVTRTRPRHSRRRDFSNRAFGLWRVQVRISPILRSVGVQRYLLCESVEHRHVECPSLLVLKHWFWPPQPLNQNISLDCYYSDVRIHFVPAAAAGSTAGLLFSSLVVEVDCGAKGLRLLCCRLYAFLLTGERESRSKRDERLTSDSVWSNLERLEVRRSSSAIWRSSEFWMKSRESDWYWKTRASDWCDKAGSWLLYCQDSSTSMIKIYYQDNKLPRQ